MAMTPAVVGRVYGAAGVAAAPVVVPVEESSQIGEARRAATAFAAAAGFDAVAQGRVALIATEAASNLVKHARHGVLIVQAPGAPPHDGAPPPFVELLAVDRGPGMADPDASMRDGFSTAGTAGSGLGAIRRVADYFEIDSHVGHGTVVLARVWPPTRRLTDPGPAALAPHVGAVCVPLGGESVCGDAWAVIVGDDGGTTVLLADGLGHGEAAAVAAEAAARAAVAAVATARADGVAPCALLERAHALLRPTRGAAVAVAALDARAGRLRTAGVGNVAGIVVRPELPAATRSLVSQNGIVGHQMRSCHEVAYDWPPGALLVLATDGVKAQWRLDAYPGLARRHPAVIAATLWRDYGRGRDDATVVVVRAPAEDHARRSEP